MHVLAQGNVYVREITDVRKAAVEVGGGEGEGGGEGRGEGVRWWQQPAVSAGSSHANTVAHGILIVCIALSYCIPPRFWFMQFSKPSKNLQILW
jgi:hypothetical protein